MKIFKQKHFGIKQYAMTYLSESARVVAIVIFRSGRSWKGGGGDHNYHHQNHHHCHCHHHHRHLQVWGKLEGGEEEIEQAQSQQKRHLADKV